MASKVCPVCDLHSPDRSQRCECGYDFTSGQIGEALVLTSREEERDPATGRGVVTLASIPFTLSVAMLMPWATVLPYAIGAAIVLVPFQLALGIGWSLRGVRHRRRLRDRRRRAAELTRLPAARVVR